MFSKKSIYLLILFGLFCSILLTNYYLLKYDKYEISSDEKENHSMIKSDPLKFWGQAIKIKEQLQSGQNYLLTGEEYRVSYLPPRIILLFSFCLQNEFYHILSLNASFKVGFLRTIVH